MFNIGPLELAILAIVAIIVVGPDKLPGFARDAARMLKTLRELATGAREQLRDELGPEFADIDLRNLNPRTAITRAVFGDEPPDLQKYNPRNFDLRQSARGFMYDDDPRNAGADGVDLGSAPVSMVKGESVAANASRGGAWSNAVPSNGASADGAASERASANGASRPRPRPRPAAPPASAYDDGAT